MSGGNGNAPDIGSIKPLGLNEIVHGEHPTSDWFIETILPQGCYLAVGRPKVGKSFLMLQLAITLACGGRFLGYEALGCFDVLYIAAEDDPGRIKSRVALYKIDELPPNLTFICRNDLAQLAAQYGDHYDLAQFIESYLLTHPKIKCVIIDTETTVRAAWDGGSVKRDMNLNRNDYAETREFDEIAHRRRCCIFLINHTAKRKNGSYYDIHEMINRTNTSVAGASGSMVLADPPTNDLVFAGRDDSCKLFGIRARDVKEDVYLAVQQDAFAIFQNLGPYKKHQQTEAENELLLALEELVKLPNDDAEGWISSKQLGEWVNQKRGTVQRTMARMLLKADRQTWKEYRIESKNKRGYRLVKI